MLLAWDGVSDLPPGANTTTQFCDLIDPNGFQDWQSCVPGIAAWVGDGRAAGPGQTVTFTYYIEAPDIRVDRTYTLYFRLAQRTANGYAWINQPNGQRTYEFFNVHVHGFPNPCPRCQ